LNRPLDDIVGKTDFDFYPPDRAAKYVHDDEDVMLTRKNLEVVEEHQLLGSDRTAWVKVIKTPVLDDGKVSGVQAIFWDVTEQRQMEERWRSLVEQSPDSIVIHENGKITLANPAAVRLFGADTADTLRGRPILEFIDEGSRELAAERLDKLVKKETVEPMVEMKVRRLTGEVVDVEVYGRPGPGTDEVQVVFHELTRTKTLLREMHHRVRRSLSQVQSLLTLQERHNHDARVRRVFRAIRERIGAMALVHTILQDTEQESSVEMGMYLRALVLAVFDAYGTASDRIGSTVEVGDIVLDEKRASACGLIVTELVGNSLLHAFGEDPGQVEVLLTRGDNMLTLVVSDNGTGIDVHSKSSMGLSLVEMLVRDALKGTVRRDSSGGARFTIEFPNNTNQGR
jgi:PAS domain S-box-containing protein